MAGSEGQPVAVRGYVVLREVEPGLWPLAGEVDRRPGLAADAARVQAGRDAVGGDPGKDEVYAVVLRSEWRMAQRL
jgi:hypothetical protein